jgi:hypothetical protein
LYRIHPAPLAEALELEKGGPIEWIVQDRHALMVKRPTQVSAKSRRSAVAR